MKHHLQCAEQQESPSNITKYCACHERWHSCWSSSNMNRPVQCAEQHKTPSDITDPLHATKFWPAAWTQKSMNCSDQWKTDLRLFRDRSDHDPRLKSTSQPVRSPSLLFALWRRILRAKTEHFALRLAPEISPNAAPATKSGAPTSPLFLFCACREKWHSCFNPPHTWHVQYGTRINTSYPPILLRLPRNLTFMLNPPQIWNVQYKARSNTRHPPTLPNIAPATKSGIHASLLLLYYFSLHYSTFLFSSLLFSSLLCFSLLYSTFLFSTLLFSSLLYSSLLYSALLCPNVWYRKHSQYSS